MLTLMLKFTILAIFAVSSLHTAFAQAAPAAQKPATKKSPATQTAPAAQKPPAAQPKPVTGEQAMAYFAQATINWESSSTAGMRAEMVLLKKGIEKGQNVVEYKIKVTGASRLQKYSLITWPITLLNPATALEGLIVNASGAVGCPAHSNDSCSRAFDGQEIKIKYAPARGEIYRNALVSKDQKSRVFFSIVPDPILAKDAACTLEIIRLQPAFELVLVSGRGFQPSEPIAFKSNSAGETHGVQAQADLKGRFWAPFTPYVEGKTTGTAEVSARGSKCAPSISFNWGPAQ
ncbi:MAG TPA: hypothetical protein VNW97_02690 [Candidatus Saccharimonadales bacterium]|nr:hypothetical protein [Candidatus Saccharimonadales bacterium]